MKLEAYTKIDGALRTPKFREVNNSEIGKHKGDKTNALEIAKVTISTGKVFFADSASKLDMLTAVVLSNIQGAAETQWKLAEPINGSQWATVSISEMIEATLLGLEYKGEVIA